LLTAFDSKSEAHRCRYGVLHIVAARSTMAVTSTKASTTAASNTAVVGDANGCNNAAYQLGY